MKILMLAPQPFFQPRGTPISVYQRLRGLSKLGHKVDLLTFHVGQDVEIPGVTIHRTPQISFIKNVKVGPSLAKLLLDILLFYKAILMLITQRYDVIHSHEEGAFIATLLAAAFRTPHLYDMHSILSRQLVNFNFANYWPIIRLFEMLERWVINSCEAVITVGVDLETYVKAINPTVNQITIENLPVNANGRSTEQSAIDELKAKLGVQHKLPIVYTGTFERYQGLDLLFESAKIINNKNTEVCFVLVGGKPHQVEYWQNEVKKNRLEDCTYFVGIVSPSEAATYMEMADILVSPRTEGLSVPLKIYSYLYSGKPAVATKIMAHTQVLNDDIALLVAAEKEAFADGILRLVQDSALRQKLGLQARKFAEERYSPENYLTKLNMIYQALLASTPVHQQSSSALKKATGR